MYAYSTKGKKPCAHMPSLPSPPPSHSATETAASQHSGLQMLILTTGPTQNLDTVCALGNDQLRFIAQIRAKHRVGPSKHIVLF